MLISPFLFPKQYFPSYIEKFLSKIIKIDKLREKGLIITLLKVFTDIFTQNLMIKSRSPTRASSIYMLPTKITLQVYKEAGCRWQRLIVGGGGWTMPIL